jgi:hypothetical protein
MSTLSIAIVKRPVIQRHPKFQFPMRGKTIRSNLASLLSENHAPQRAGVSLMLSIGILGLRCNDTHRQRNTSFNSFVVPYSPASEA